MIFPSRVADKENECVKSQTLNINIYSQDEEKRLAEDRTFSAATLKLGINRIIHAGI